MKLNKTLKALRGLFKKYAPTGSALLDFIKQDDEFIIIYRDDKNHVISHLNSEGLYKVRYYSIVDEPIAWMDFSAIK